MIKMTLLFIELKYIDIDIDTHRSLRKQDEMVVQQLDHTDQDNEGEDDERDQEGGDHDHGDQG